MKTTLYALLSVVFFCAIVSQSAAFDFHWEIDETPEGSESVTLIQPVQVILLDEVIEVPSHSASLQLMRKYSVYLDTDWSEAQAYRLLKTFESIPQKMNVPYEEIREVLPSLWRLSDSHIQDDIVVKFQDRQRIVTIAMAAFVHADPLLAEIEGVRGRYFSKRLHHAVVRFVTDDGADRDAIKQIFNERYAVSVDVPDYSELTKWTTGEHAGRFQEFKNEELIALVSMFEELPQGMLKTPGLKYLVRRLDGTPHPIYPSAPAVAWTSVGYIEFMESAFAEQGADYIHRLILHEKAHFLWNHLFDEQLKQDWIELGGWYENPDDKDGWSTTKQTEFVSAYAHGVNPFEDMAESISFYIVNPDKLRSYSPAKYEFIQDRIMHGTRYISRIREDLTFQVYNLYPDVVYPGRIVRIDVQVEGEPEADKQITITLQLHQTGDLDAAQASHVRIFSPKGTFFDLWLYPFDPISEKRVEVGHILRGEWTLSRYAAHGYWGPDSITLRDAQGNERHEAQTDFGWKLYINNPLEDNEAPVYIKNSMRLSLRDSMEDGRHLQILTAHWQLFERTGVKTILARVNDESDETYSRRIWGKGKYDSQTGEASVELKIADYHQTGTYTLNYIRMTDTALNNRRVYFTAPEQTLRPDQEMIDEAPATIEIQTTNPDSTPPVLDLNQITVKAEPTNPKAPNGETVVDITFRIKDNISGYSKTDAYLRDPHGVMHRFVHYHPDFHATYFSGDPTVYETYEQKIILPVGSIPGTWGVAEMTIYDKARNTLRADFTEIVRFEVDDGTVYANSDVNEDGEINILDLVIVASFDASNERADVNGDGIVNILDLVVVASHLGEEDIAAPAVNNPTTNQIASWITQAMQADDGSLAFRKGIRALQNLLLKLHPETTALLPNYPNPFNPETWIPYHLANTSDVQITIYDTRGSIVRTLVLGHQAAGYYTDRNRAAYWDGRNGLGESVASGVYFYRLQADTVSFLRKMLILK